MASIATETNSWNGLFAGKPSDAATCCGCSRNQPRTRQAKIGAMGFSMGGGFVQVLGTNVMPTSVGVVSLLLLAACGAADLWMRQGVMPQMTEVRERVAEARAAGRELDPQLEADWKAMHGLSVRVNGAVLLCGLALLYALVHARQL